MAGPRILSADPSPYLLTLASKPPVELEEVLQTILEKALETSSSEIAGSLLICDSSISKSELVGCVVVPQPASRPAGLLKRWRECPSAAHEVLLSGKSRRIDDSDENPTLARLLASSRSSLSVPLVDEAQVLGVLHVESVEFRHYTDSHCSALQDLAAAALPAIRRLMLKEQMAKAGIEMEMIGVSPAFLEMERQLRLAAAYDKSPVLITGERGSGKEMAAWAIHCWSSRRSKPFVPVLMPALPHNLVPDELFGHERHAFTGAETQRSGKFEAAAGGTVFLDEIADMPLPVQSALLRVIDGHELARIGRDLPVKTNARVVAATNQDLLELMAHARFREDLYDRLTVFEIRVPALRQRPEDIPILATHFLRRYCSELRRFAVLAEHPPCAACGQAKVVGCATSEFYQTLQTYAWPGNVRELQHVLLHLACTVRDEILDVHHLPERFHRRVALKPDPSEREGQTLEAVIRRHIEQVLRSTGYNKSRAAKILGLRYSTLQSKLGRLGIERRPPASDR